MRSLFVLLFLLPLFAEAQTVTVEHSYKYDPATPFYSRDSFYFNLHKRMYLQATGKMPAHAPAEVRFNRNGDTLKTTTTYKITDTSLAYLVDAFSGHEVILIPGDTIKIFSAMEKSGILLPWSRSLAYSGQNRYIHGVFDSLGYIAGDVKIDMLNPKDKSVDEFIRLADERYQKRIQFLDGYGERHKIPAFVKDMVLQEIYAAYTRDLVFLQSWFMKSESAPDLGNRIKERVGFEKLKHPGFQKAVTADHVIYQYLLFTVQPFQTTDFYNKERYQRLYNVIQDSYTGAFRDELLTKHVSFFLNNADVSLVDPFIGKYRSDCSDPVAVAFIDSVFNQKRSLAKRTVKDLLNTRVSRISGGMVTLDEIVVGKPTLIDCWASWCQPCIAEFPASKKLEAEFEGRVNFIYLSFDQDVNAWKSKTKELNIEASTFHVSDGFKSEFAQFFKITSIPRYILLDAKGNLIDPDSPRPSDRELKKMLQVTLK